VVYVPEVMPREVRRANPRDTEGVQPFLNSVRLESDEAVNATARNLVL
jgi:hypothetical protein